ncbi:Protein lifeguard 3 [Collichthys lucidus]|uniref:Protein lifeguard 3 n=1 Tax=Collichthys lucidus TaxID=240159 RepID=A0A4U5U257_COLLU|nr:Protein lifeguard 3 [Collichthys lucidus]
MTSKTDDNPPPYEDALHHPKYVNDPRSPQHGSSLPPPPSYSPSPGPPGYWAQESVYPPAGMWAAPGHSPSGMPMTIPTLSGGLPASNTGDMDDFLSSQWESTSIRHAFIRKVDFTSCGGFLCIASVLLTIIGIVTAVVLSFQYVPWLHMLYAGIGAIIYTLFLVYNTQLLIGNRELAISPEEYIYGALSLYIDIVHIFLFILQVSGAATE